jgi:hypothetical protein
VVFNPLIIIVMTFPSGLGVAWRPLLAVLVAFSRHQFNQIRGRQLYSIVRNIPYVIDQRHLRTHVRTPVMDGVTIPYRRCAFLPLS